jgi:hypothetical protein
MCLPVKPFKIEREWIHAGLSCAVVQAREASHRCGYVRVPPSHPAHGKSYNDLENTEVHRGLTFSQIEPCTEHKDGQGFWFGFDCAHCYDTSYDPEIDLDKISEDTRKIIKIMHPCSPNEHFWSEQEVAVETEKLAEQLAAMTA